MYQGSNAFNSFPVRESPVAADNQPPRKPAPPVPPHTANQGETSAKPTTITPVRSPLAGPARITPLGPTAANRAEAAPSTETKDAAPNLPATIAPAKPPAATPPPAPPDAPKAATGPTPAAPASAGRVRQRHFGVMLSFFVLVVFPVLVSAWYLWMRAADQYASTVGFSVRTEEMSSAVELLGGITELSGSSSSDTDILYEFLQSQKLVADLDQQLDLRTIWSKPDNDPVFSYHAPGSIEDLVDYWQRMVQVSYDAGTGLIEVRVLAFEAEDATRIAEALFAESTEMINSLSDIAREDAIRHAREELDATVERLTAARQAVTEFRNRHQIVDPESDL